MHPLLLAKLWAWAVALPCAIAATTQANNPLNVKPAGPVGQNASEAAQHDKLYPQSMSHQEQVKKLLQVSQTQHQQALLRNLTSFPTRQYNSSSGSDAAKWLKGEMERIVAGNPRARISEFNHPWGQPSLIATIAGKRPDTVILGAHFDSKALPGLNAPGANDNGSGVVANLGALGVLADAQFDNENTIEVHLYAAEEFGKQGSDAVFTEYSKSNKSIVGMLQQDVVGHAPSRRVTVMKDFVDSALTKFVSAVAAAYTGSDPIETTCGSTCSDHFSASKQGFPAAYVEGDWDAEVESRVHTPGDTYETIDWEAIERHTKLAIGFLVEASYLNCNGCSWRTAKAKDPKRP
ncbi:hypothetical protein HIM_05196 [Hirsutella minnesotensis 3608]|uniref:Peptide hydrolase n=1 Tax=Hirsutella minnesotensis 3608 TaxID=1043627 RepID=A0A0F7ZPH3_9HYPO|nr:hypothetical protein HIM_05196 [Hirsutella minnesotensis 3608]